MTKWIAYLCLGLAAGLTGAGAGAQTYYKSTMPDGSVSFGDKPAPGAAKVEPLKSEAPKPAERPASAKGDASKAGARKATAPDPAVVKRLREDKANRERAEAEVRAAEKSLRAAEAALAKGEEPLPGERTGTAGGKSRLNEDYWKRQRKLKDDVENARANLERVKTRVR